MKRVKKVVPPRPRTLDLFGDGNAKPPSPPAASLPPSPPEPPGEPPSKLELKFLEFHAMNPHVYLLLRDLSLKLRLVNCRERLWEVLRWKMFVEIERPDGQKAVKLSNNHRAYYARLLMDRNSELKDLFVLRPAADTGAWKSAKT